MTAAVRIRELRERRDAVRFVADVDKDVAAGNLQNPAFQNFVAGRRRKVAVIFEKMLIFFRIHCRGRRFRLFRCSGRLVFCHCVSSPGSLLQDSIKCRDARRGCQTPVPLNFARPQSADWTCWRGAICLMISSTMAG